MITQLTETMSKCRQKSGVIQTGPNLFQGKENGLYVVRSNCV